MPLNVGFVQINADGVNVRVHYDATQPPGDTQPLINGPRGFCLDLTNTSGRNRQVVVGLGDNERTVPIGQGDPVTSGPATGRSRTAAQMATLGITTRGDLLDLTGL